jgi:hypothetical protein
MPKAAPGPRPHPAAEAQALSRLSRLARTGAYAVRVGDAFAIFSPRNDFAGAIATISASDIALALERGWLAPAGQDRWHLTAAGMAALRRLKSGGPGQVTAAPSRPRMPGGRKKAGTLGPMPAEGSLVWLRRRKDKDGRPLVTEAQFAAGERLGADFRRARLSPRVTADWSGTVAGRRVRRSAPGAGVEIGDAVIAARQRLNGALAAVGPELAGILLEVCCHDIGLEAAGRAAGWPQRAAKIVLQLALTRLARHYGLIPPDHPFHARMRHWGDDDYRPGLDAWR